MDPEKLKKIGDQVRIGGKGSVRRKAKITPKVGPAIDRKTNDAMKKLKLVEIRNIDTVNIIKTDGEVIHFEKPTVKAAFLDNTFAVTGNAEKTTLSDLLNASYLKQKKDMGEASKENKTDANVADEPYQLNVISNILENLFIEEVAEVKENAAIKKD